MPCNSDYLDPNHREQELQRAAKLLVYVLRKSGQQIPQWVSAEAKNPYASAERSIPILCATLKKLTPKLRNSIVYNAKDRTARDLANWYEDHKLADKQRLKEEAKAKTGGEIRAQALAKLTEAEMIALGLK